VLVMASPSRFGSLRIRPQATGKVIDVALAGEVG
jgi:hypothetical protein